MADEDLLLNLISIAQNSVLTWLAVGLGTFVGLFEIVNSKVLNEENKRKLIHLAIAVCVFSFYMDVVHMGDIYRYRDDFDKLRPDLSPKSIQSSEFILMDKIIKQLAANPIFIILFLIPIWIALERLINGIFQQINITWELLPLLIFYYLVIVILTAITYT